MASGDPVVILLEAMPPAANPATLGFRNGGSTPAERNRLWEFDSTTAEYMDFRGVLHGYGGSGGLTLHIKWSADGVASGNVVWRAAFRAIEDDTHDVDASHTYSYQSVTATAPTVDGEVDYADIVFTDAQIDGLNDGDMFILRVGRDAGNASDTMNSNDAQLWAVTGEET